MAPRFSIGIDLGTTNSALAFVALDGGGRSDIFPVPQWDTAATVCEAAVLPSYLYLPEKPAAGPEDERGGELTEWVVGRLARRMAGERPGRVAHSAKSWLCHPSVDHAAPFLPWGSDEIEPQQKISPITASALILGALRRAWDSRFAGNGADWRFDAQEITVTVPASFDEMAQRLTRAAAEAAGFPPTVRLLEEPQAAFYACLERHGAGWQPWLQLAGDGGQPRHVLVVDIGGGTSDFSLFALQPAADHGVPEIDRIAVSDHILLGGDNIDLAIAHHLEPRLISAGGTLSSSEWNFLIARCRDVKEQALAGDGDPGDVFPIAVPGRGGGLIAGLRSAQLSRREIETIILEGFFPSCAADDRPRRRFQALSEWGLPFAADGAVTRHLAAFLAGRPRVDAVLFNGGSLAAPRLRRHLAEQIAAWQDGTPLLVLDNSEPELAVARGAARFGALLRQGGRRIKGGAGHAVFLALHRQPPAGGGADAAASLVCVLPHGAQPEETFDLTELAIELRLNRPVRFETYTSTRHEGVGPGTLVPLNEQEFRPLPPLQTTARLDARHRRGDAQQTLPVALAVKLNELGVLQVCCRSVDPGLPASWPLEFNLRPLQHGDDGAAEPRRQQPAGAANIAANASEAAIAQARQRLQAMFAAPPGRQGKFTAARLFKDLESVLALPRADWNWVLVRALWPALAAAMPHRARSVEHEEAWLGAAGFLLRPGFGAPSDEARIDELWPLHESGLCFPGKRIRPQLHILWRRVAGGLSRERQEQLLAAEIATLRDRTDAPSELVRLVGSLERIAVPAKIELASRFIGVALDRLRQRQDAAPHLAALGLLLNRAPLYTGPESVLPPEWVEKAYEAFADLDWHTPECGELPTLFLRAARVIDNRNLDVPSGARRRIATKLEKSGVNPSRVAKVRGFVPVERGERSSLYGEALPPGLLLADR